MDSIVVKVSDLYERVKQLKVDNMQYVSLSILDSDELDGDYIPPALKFDAIENKNDLAATDYEEINAVEDVQI